MVTYRSYSLTRGETLVVITPSFWAEIKILSATQRKRMMLEIKGDKPLEFTGERSKEPKRDLGKMEMGKPIKVKPRNNELIRIGHAGSDLAAVRMEVAAGAGGGWILMKVSAGYTKGNLEDCAILSNREIFDWQSQGIVPIGASYHQVLTHLIRERSSIEEEKQTRRKALSKGRRMPRPGVYPPSRKG